MQNRQVIVSIFIFAFFISTFSQLSEAQRDSLKEVYDKYHKAEIQKIQKQSSSLDYVVPKSMQEIPVLIDTQEVIPEPEIESERIEVKVQDEEFDELAEEKKYRTRLLSPDVTLKPFGFDYFRKKENVSTIEQYGPVDPNYVIGVGDEIVIMVWGDVEFTQSLIVNRIGTISVKGIGRVNVAGLHLSQLQKNMIHRLSKVYSSIRYGKPDATTFVDVALGRLRTKKVFIVGDVAHPGLYNISAMSSVMNALIYAGGPLPRGSIRNILVKRNGQVVKTVDCYSYFIDGDRSGDITLLDNDIVVIPPAKKTVSIQGAVHRQAIFELKENEGLVDLLKYCGGLEPEAYLANLNLDRTIKGDKRKTFTLIDPFKRIATGEKITLFDKDKIMVSTIDEQANTITIEGSVFRPNDYEFKPGMTVKDAVILAGGLKEDAYTLRAEVFRVHDDYTSEVYAVDLTNILEKDGKENILLKKWDVIKIFSKWDLKTKSFVYVRGEIKNPGRYLLRDSMTIQDIILLAGGFTKFAKTDTLEISRIVTDTFFMQELTVSIKVPVNGDFFKTTSSPKVRLQHRDNVIIKKDANYIAQELVELKGEFKVPGIYSKTAKNEKLSSLIRRAGGLKKTAYIEGARFIRSKDSVGLVALDLNKIINDASFEGDIVLEHGDQLSIPIIPRTVRVMGAVGLPSSVVFKEGKGIDYYAEMAGGYTTTADKRRGYVILANGQVEKRRGKTGNYINAGSQIIIPEKKEEEERDWLEMTKNVVAILSSIVSILVLFQTLNNSMSNNPD